MNGTFNNNNKNNNNNNNNDNNNNNNNDNNNDNNIYCHAWHFRSSSCSTRERSKVL